MYLANFVATGVLATIAFAVTAQTPPTPVSPPVSASAQAGPGVPDRAAFDPAKMQERKARMQERKTQRQAELKQKLQLTPAQESAWTSFTNALKPSGQRQRMDREALAKMNTPDRIDHVRALRNARIAEMDRRGEATKAFYATLTPQQQQTFDAETVRRGHRGGHGHRHGHMHRGGPAA